MTGRLATEQSVANVRHSGVQARQRGRQSFSLDPAFGGDIGRMLKSAAPPGCAAGGRRAAWRPG